jgi:hypothetical protein
MILTIKKLKNAIKEAKKYGCTDDTPIFVSYTSSDDGVFYNQELWKIEKTKIDHQDIKNDGCYRKIFCLCFPSDVPKNK